VYLTQTKTGSNDPTKKAKKVPGYLTHKGRNIYNEGPTSSHSGSNLAGQTRTEHFPVYADPGFRFPLALELEIGTVNLRPYRHNHGTWSRYLRLVRLKEVTFCDFWN
jgi:hypothetical protein